MSRFSKLKDKVFEIQIDGEHVKVKPLVGKAAMFFVMKNSQDEESLTKAGKLIEDIVIAGNKDLQKKIDGQPNKEFNKENLDAAKDDIATHLFEYISEASILYGFTTREEIKNKENELKKVKSQ